MAPSESHEPPARVGPYHVVQVIGEGGMGVIYEAEQKEPVRRRVALKMIKLGLDSKEVLGRFEAERQALAVMDHPGIATVFDAGISQHGRPWFAMEFVRGVRIDEFCDQQLLSTRQRLGLFVKVCEAVQHAHQKGVIHRDIKPGNILVTEVDGRPTPKIIDFGVAKATGQRLTEKTVATGLGRAMGTLAYMSPEQAEMSGLDVDTRADIYSLGVVLFKLLTGRVPLDPSEVGAPAFYAALIQRDVTLPTISGSLARLQSEQLETVAHLRDTDGGTLRRELSGDLDWIVHRALEKDRNRRYPTAAALADDLARFVEHRPVAARPPSVGYRLGKFVRRNRVAVGFGSALALTLVGAAVATGLQAARIAAERNRAEQEASKARSVSEFMESILLAADPIDAMGPEVPLLEAMDSATARLADGFAGDPEVEAAARTAMGRVYLKLGRYAEAEPLLAEALRLRLQPGVPGDLDLAETLHQWGRLLRARGEVDSADVVLTRALALRRELAHPTDPALAETLVALALLRTDQGRIAEAEAAFIEARDLQRVIDPTGLAAAAPASGLGQLYRLAGDLDKAEDEFRQVLDVREAQLPAEHPLLGESINNLAAVVDDLGRAEEAVELYQRAIPILEHTFGPDSDRVSGVLGNLALALSALERHDEAGPLYRRALAIDRTILGDDHLYVGIDHLNLGIHLCRSGSPQEGLGAVAEANRIFAGALDETQWERAIPRASRGTCLGQLQRFDEGERELTAAIEVFRSALGDEHPRTVEAVEHLDELRKLRSAGGA